MANVLADLALESEAAVAASLRIARAFEEGDRTFGRLALPIMKYWVCKRGAPLAAEALECLGGNGFIETMEAPVPQLYRDIHLGSVWEGSGNIIALDFLRGLAKTPEALPAFFAECEAARRAEPRLDAHLRRLERDVSGLGDHDPQWIARTLIEDLAVAFGAALLVEHAPPALADAYCASRLDGRRHKTFGTLPPGTEAGAIIDRALAL